MKNIFLQIGSSRDGTNPFGTVAQREGYFTVLAATADAPDHTPPASRQPFDLILHLSKPASPLQVMQAYMHAGLPTPPQLVLAGSEACSACAGQVREMLATPQPQHSFIPLDKYAQRMALSKAQVSVAQPAFRFFASLLSIRDARDALLYPCVIKAVEHHGGTGVWLVSSAQALDNTLDTLLHSTHAGERGFSGYLVESWLQGISYSLQGVVCDGVPNALSCCQLLTEQCNNAGGATALCTAGYLAQSAQPLPVAIRTLMQHSCTAFGYRQGAFQLDFILLDNQPWFVEMRFHLPATEMIGLVDEVTGADWAGIAFHLAQGNPCSGLPPVARSQAVGLLRLRQPAQLAAAQLWLRSHPHGQLQTPVSVSCQPASPATLRIAAADGQQILALFCALRAASPLSPQENVSCAG